MSFFSAITALKEALFEALLGDKLSGGKPTCKKSHHDHHHPHSIQPRGDHRHPVMPVKGGLVPHAHMHQQPLPYQPSYSLFPLNR